MKREGIRQDFFSQLEDRIQSRKLRKRMLARWQVPNLLTHNLEKQYPDIDLNLKPTPERRKEKTKTGKKESTSEGARLYCEAEARRLQQEIDRSRSLQKEGRGREETTRGRKEKRKGADGRRKQPRQKREKLHLILTSIMFSLKNEKRTLNRMNDAEYFFSMA